MFLAAPGAIVAGMCDTALFPHESKEALRRGRAARTMRTMGFWFHVRTCIAALFGLAVALAGLALVLQLGALLLWQYGIALQKPAWPRLPIGLLFADHAKLATTVLAPYLQYIPQLEWGWLANREDRSATHAVAVWLVEKVHIGVVPALLGVPLALGGGRLLLRRIGALAFARRYRADRLRRLGQYRRELSPERLEPDLAERPEPRFEYLGERFEARNDRFAYRKEPFIGADGEVPAAGDAELPLAGAGAELPQGTALKSQKYY